MCDAAVTSATGAAAGERPFISVVVPALNEEAVLGDCLRSLAAQDYPGRLEVIVVDNGSTDGTADLARRHGARVLSEPRPGVCQARQRGTAAAQGQIVVSTDADTTFPTTWLSRIAATLSDQPQCVATCGPCEFVAAPWWGPIYARGLFGFVAAFHRLTGRVLYASATNIAFRRADWDGYDTSMTQGGDELALLRSLRRHGPIHFDRSRVTLTSARRLHRGLLYNLFVTCLFYYLTAYAVNRLTGRRVVGSAPAIRPDSAATSRTRAAFALTAAAAGVAVLWWLTPADVL